ncbi:DUF1489 family protein [Aurantimonas sp. A2-1-M11]|uniref:DUF1489 family protein n=1 Tax=Aurantimonas sp. A2-1-M11 TaxID=3113712 RepID=UPI002F958B11
MPLHLIKLCVGIGSVEELEEHVAARLAAARLQGRAVEQAHVTRMVPKRIDELLDDGSLYWVIKGQVQVRQRLVAVQPFKDADDVGRCRLVLEPTFARTAWQPRRPFQGWRYLKPQDAPRDIGTGESGEGDLPVDMQRELIDLGLF